MKSSWGKTLVIFEVIFSIAVTNMLFIAWSVLSLFIMFPVMLIGTLYYLRRMYLYREYTGILYNFAKFIKGNIIASFKLLYPLVLFVGLLLLSIFYYNQIIIELFHPFLVLLVYFVQAFLLYQTVGVMLVAGIIFIQDQAMLKRDILTRAFLIFNAHPVKALLAMLSLIMGTLVVIRVFPFFYLIVLPISLFMFYVVFSDILEKNQPKHNGTK